MELTSGNISNKIYTVRGMQVMLDFDLAHFYCVETRVLNQAVKRNLNRFPELFRFQLTPSETLNLKSQFVISSSNYGGRRVPVYECTEQGIATTRQFFECELFELDSLRKATCNFQPSTFNFS